MHTIDVCLYARSAGAKFCQMAPTEEREASASVLTVYRLWNTTFVRHLNRAKAQHAIALALVGRYLVVPPKRMGGMAEDNAPLGQWEIVGVYDKASECQQEMERCLTIASNQGNLPIGEPEKMRSLGVRFTWTSASQLLNTTCVANDDSCLKEAK